ncbi:MAG: ABC transporter substrate-binding protein [Candidatus Bathyarchaeota archaeon]|nr:ABC transporter substrate-binding protein [Candidatus Bathyarchaeota archaeon]
MSKKKTIPSALLLLLALALSFIPMVTVYAQDEVPNGPWADEMIIFLQGGDATAVPKIETGEMDMYMWWLSTENTRLAEESEAVELVTAYGLYNEFFINPLVTTENYNPFQIREVREALNWLIDRSYMVNELWFGRGVPKYHFPMTSMPDYGRIADHLTRLTGEYAYDFERAKVAVFTALEDAGATLQEGTWYYEGDPIVINLVIRTEDERRPSGDYLAAQLEKLGFTVERLYKPSAEAYTYWNNLDRSKRGDWHIYTAGWISLAVEAYDDDDPWFMMSPDNAPLYGEYEVSPLLREAIDKLNDGDYGSMEERNELLETYTSLWLEDGTHIYYIDQIVSFPYSADLRTFVFDVNGGSQSLWSLRTIGFPEPGGSVIVGARALFIEGFNPGAGFSWLYDVYSQYMVQEPIVWPHPHTGTYIPVRADFTVETAGPDGKLSVPSDALVYDLASESFVTVGSGVEATSKVTWDFTLGKWHHGQDVNRADILATIAQKYKLVLPESDLYDAVAASPDRVVFVDRLRGAKFLSDNVLEIYIDYWHPDESFIAAMAGVDGELFPAVPWELWALMNDVVREQETAWSPDNADIWGVDMLDLTKGTSLPILADAHADLSAANYIPPELSEWVTASDASARWAAQADFHSEMGHFWISAGPWMFDHADVDALQLFFSAFREYPYKADVWEPILTVKIPEVAPLSIPTTVVPGLSATFEMSVTVLGAGYDRASMKYILVDPRGDVVGVGQAENLGGGTFSIPLTGGDTGALSVGSYKLITITVGEEAAKPVTEDISFTVTPELAYFQTLVQEIQAQLGGRIGDLEDTVDAMSATIDDQNAALAASANTANMLMALAAVSLVVAIVAVALSLRK